MSESFWVLSLPWGDLDVQSFLRVWSNPGCPVSCWLHTVYCGSNHLLYLFLHLIAECLRVSGDPVVFPQQMGDSDHSCSDRHRVPVIIQEALVHLLVFLNWQENIFMGVGQDGRGWTWGDLRDGAVFCFCWSWQSSAHVYSAACDPQRPKMSSTATVDIIGIAGGLGSRLLCLIFKSLEGNFWDYLLFRFRTGGRDLSPGNLGFFVLVCWELFLGEQAQPLRGVYSEQWSLPILQRGGGNK